MTHPGHTVVLLRDYTVKYGSFTAVDRASFDMPPGACGLLGKNGAGKSSILKAVLGLIEPAGGRAAVLGHDTATDGRSLRDQIGYMPEKEAALPRLTGLEMVVLAGRLSGLPARVAKQRAHEVLYLVGMDEPRYRNVDTYSLGMKQKVKLATALVHDPALLFLDEPTNGLDPEGRKEVLQLLGDLVRHKGKSLILSSHILSDVESLCEHVVLIDDGRVIGEGPVAELTRAAGRVYEVKIRGGLEQFAIACREEGLLREAPDEDTFLLYLDADAGPELVFRLAQRAGAQIRLLEPQRRSLSDVFLEAVRQDGELATVEGAARA